MVIRKSTANRLPVEQLTTKKQRNRKIGNNMFVSSCFAIRKTVYILQWVCVKTSSIWVNAGRSLRKASHLGGTETDASLMSPDELEVFHNNRLQQKQLGQCDQSLTEH